MPNLTLPLPVAPARMRRVIAALLAALALCTPAGAQSWQAYAGDSGALISAGAHAPAYSMHLYCNAPSQGGVPLIQTGEHESSRTEPFEMILAFNSNLIDPMTAPPELAAATVTIDGTGYRLPPVPYDEFYGQWFVRLAMADPIWLALVNAREVIVDPGLGIAYAYPVDGLQAALVTTLQTCIGGWSALGYPLPAALTQQAAPAAAAAPAPVASTSPARARMQASLQSACNGAFTLDPEAVTATELDGDGREDVAVFYGGVTCADATMGFGAGLCGASQCATEFFLSGSSQPGAAADYATYSQAVRVEATRPGQIGLAMRLGACRDMGLMPDCLIWLGVENGRLRRVN